MLARLVPCVLALAACSPKSPGDSASDGESTGAPAMTTTSQVPTEPTTSPSPWPGTTDASSSSTTGELDPCSWFWPEFEELRFCPAPVELDPPITGMTPAGPITLRFALFGLQHCASCPNAEDPAITFYAEPPGLETQNPAGDHLDVEVFGKWDPWAFARVAGEPVSLGAAEVSLELTSVPSEEETSPPLDEAAPPVLSGTVTIQGDGWDLAATFDATLCNDLNWAVACE